MSSSKSEHREKPQNLGVQFPFLRYSEEAIDGEPSPEKPSFPNGTARDDWRPKASWLTGTERRRKQKSLSEALNLIRFRRGSVSDSAKEIGDALKAPISPRLVALCGLWFMTSIFSNASSKSILIAFRYPVTLTVVQFAFVSVWCFISSAVARQFPAIQKAIPVLRFPIRRPSKALIITTLPLTAFQVGGHILNSDAMSRIPVSLVHTIKGLSPLLTVGAYRLVFRVEYSIPTYLSLIPLTVGVIMACSANISGDFIGLVNAFGSTILFVTQNIISKRLFNDAARTESEGVQASLRSSKPDKLNLLCYSSMLAFLVTFPIWVWSEAFVIFHNIIEQGTIPLAQRPDALDHGRLTLEFIFNGTFHFTQSLVAFVLLSMVSPVTYSVASLIKRTFVICFAIVWFGNSVTNIQGFGIGLTFLGLYLYDRTSDAARADRRARLLHANAERPLLPLAKEKGDEPAKHTNGHSKSHPLAYVYPSPNLSQQENFAQANGHVESGAGSGAARSYAYTGNVVQQRESPRVAQQVFGSPALAQSGSPAKDAAGLARSSPQMGSGFLGRDVVVNGHGIDA